MKIMLVSCTGDQNGESEKGKATGSLDKGFRKRIVLEVASGAVATQWTECTSILQTRILHEDRQKFSDRANLKQGELLGCPHLSVNRDKFVENVAEKVLDRNCVQRGIVQTGMA